MQPADNRDFAKHQNRTTWFFVISAILAMGVMLAVKSVVDYNREMRLLNERLMAQARVVDETLSVNLNSTSLIIDNIRQEIDDTSPRNSGQLNTYLKQQVEFTPGIRTILITDSRGFCTHSSREQLIGMNFSERDYFRAPLNNPGKYQLFISPPFKTVLGTFVLNISKPVTDKQGKFRGVITTSFEPAYFQSLLKSTLYAPDNRIALLHSDGTVFIAVPEGANSIVGQNLMKQGSLYSRHFKEGSKASIQSGQSATTGDKRVFAYITNIPKELRLDKQLVVAASRNLNKVLLPWKISTGVQFSVYSLLSLVIIIGTKRMLLRETERLKSTEYQRALLDSMQAHIAILDINGVIVSVNEAWKKFADSNRLETGELPRNTDVGTSYLRVCQESSGEFSAEAPEAVEGITAVLSGTKHSFSLEYPCHSHGLQRWFSMTVEPLRTPDGGAVVTHTNITTRKLMEDALKTSEERYSILFENAGDAIMILDSKGHILNANKILCSRLGYSEEELFGVTPAFFDTPKFAAMVPARLQQLAESGEVLFESEHVAKDGTVIPVEIGSRVIELSGQTVVMSIVRDISERKLAENELKDSRQQLANIINFLPDATFVIDNDMRVIAWNRAMEEMTGICKEEILGQGDYAYTIPFYGERRKQLLDLLDISDAELEAKYSDVQRKGATLSAEAFVPAIYGGKGAYIWASGTPLFSSEGKRVGAIEIIRDITAQKQLEQALRDAKEAAEAANRAKSEFLANMSHEIRTPMNAITGMAYLVQQTELDSKQREYVTRIKSAADSLLSIINDILDFSKIEAGKMELESVAFELKDVLNSVHNIVAARAEEKNLEITFSIAPEIPEMLIGDQLRLRQILNNLASNAVKFTEKGSIAISATTGSEDLQPDRIVLTFSVADTGIGMDSWHLEHIFEPFTQADSSITRKYGGTGLGLSIAVRLLEIMGSRLEVVSEPELGSTFSFTVEFGRIHDHVRHPLQTPEDLKGMKILVVDDSVDALQMLDSMLRALTFRTTLVESGTAALGELARAASDPNESPYRLVLLDWRMPEMDGVETARRIRDECHLSPAPEIILISGYISTHIRKEANDAGIRVFLNKPFASTTLFNGIMEALGREYTPQRLGISHYLPPAASIKQLRDVRILLVEDDKVNQIVAREILKQFGADVTTVEDGQIAVETVHSGSAFDMVFMDVQMPGMNGCEATAAIRETKGKLELPIIAMTAHAFAEERNRCLAAGMNDHITKPIDPDQLYSLILRWLPPEKICTASPPEKNSDDNAPAQLFPDELPGIDTTSILKRCGGNTALAREIIISFREQNRNAGIEIQSAVENNIEQAKLLIHNVKGLSGNIGAASLFATMSQLETDLNNGDTNVQPLLASMAQQLAEVFKAADFLEKTYVPISDDSTFIQLPPQELEPLLKELHDSLQNNSLNAKNLYEQMKNSIRQPEREEINRYIAILDFEKAMDVLERAAASSGIKLLR